MDIKNLKEILDSILEEDNTRILLTIYNEKENEAYITNIDNILVEHNKISLRGTVKK